MHEMGSAARSAGRDDAGRSDAPVDGGECETVPGPWSIASV